MNWVYGIIIVLFSSSVFAKVYNCTVTILEGGNSKIVDMSQVVPYEFIIDTGNEDNEDVLALLDEVTGNFKKIIVPINSVGKIYFIKPNPFHYTENIDVAFYITDSQRDFYTGFFFDGTYYPKIITIREYENPTLVVIYDTFDIWGGTHKGTCE